MREPAGVAIKRADLIIIIGEDRHNIAQKYCLGKLVIKSNIHCVNGGDFKNKAVVAFCGIGRPEKFFDELEKNQTQIIAKFSYPDHHNYLDCEVGKMINLAAQNQTKLITTKKDWVRLEKKYQKKIEHFDIEAKFENEEKLKEIIKNLIHDKKSN
jgi:tetraacyldisaccharide 4'-kinase